jgi:hypothetical protein
MAGYKMSAQKLNTTLLFLLRLLRDNNITNWFIGYGTLLGIVRNNSCINGDDDIDIICDARDYNKIKQIIIANNLPISRRLLGNKILKTLETSEYASIDFYMAQINDKGDYYDMWENVVWSDCYAEDKTLIEYTWNDNTLYLPNNYERKLLGRYGADWKIPKDTKGPRPKKKIL